MNRTHLAWILLLMFFLHHTRIRIWTLMVTVCQISLFRSRKKYAGVLSLGTLITMKFTFRNCSMISKCIAFSRLIRSSRSKITQVRCWTKVITYHSSIFLILIEMEWLICFLSTRTSFTFTIICLTQYLYQTIGKKLQNSARNGTKLNLDPFFLISRTICLSTLAATNS